MLLLPHKAHLRRAVHRTGEPMVGTSGTRAPKRGGCRRSIGSAGISPHLGARIAVGDMARTRRRCRRACRRRPFLDGNRFPAHDRPDLREESCKDSACPAPGRVRWRGTENRFGRRRWGRTGGSRRAAGPGRHPFFWDSHLARIPCMPGLRKTVHFCLAFP
jgi:hypothetical protein